MVDNSDRIKIYKELSRILKSNFDIHFKKMISLFKIMLCHKRDDINLEAMHLANSYESCEVTHILEAVLNSKVESLAERKERLVSFEAYHKKLHGLLDILFEEFQKTGYVNEKTYEDFAHMETRSL
jgi:hypothetical protein